MTVAVRTRGGGSRRQK